MKIEIHIKPIYRVFNVLENDYDTRRDYITSVHGDRLEIESGTWYLWYGDNLITSGNTRDLHAVVPHRKYVKQFDYAPIAYL